MNVFTEKDLKLIFEKLPLIEWVCYANKGRSKPAELISQNKIIELGAENEYLAISSGSHVDQLDKEPSIERMKQVIQMVHQRDDYKINHRRIKRSVKNDDEKDIKILYKEISDIFHKEEIEYRTEALQYFNIKGTIDPSQRQFVPIKNTVAVFPMSEINKKLVEETYSNSEIKKPRIEVLGIANAYGKNKEAYFSMFEQLINVVNKKTEEIVKYK